MAAASSEKVQPVAGKTLYTHLIYFFPSSYHFAALFFPMACDIYLIHVVAQCKTMFVKKSAVQLLAKKKKKLSSFLFSLLLISVGYFICTWLGKLKAWQGAYIVCYFYKFLDVNATLAKSLTFDIFRGQMS